MLLKPSEVAAELGVSRTWLYDAAKTGRIPSIRIGGEEGPLRFVPEDVDRWIDEARKAWRPGGPGVATRGPGEEVLPGERGVVRARRAGGREATQPVRGQHRNAARGRSQRR
jgi:excisionase family DNA binding protein